MKLRITEYLEVDLAREQWCCSRCGGALTGARENYKHGCLVAERPMEEVHPPIVPAGAISFRFDPAFMSRLGSDKLDWRTASSDFSLAGAVLGLQRPALDTLMSDSLAARLADAEVKVAEPARLLSYAEVQGRLREAVWAELKTASKSGDIDSLRRNLQREHVKRLAAGLLRPTPTQAADVRSVHRQEALALEAALRAALSGKGWNATTRAHLADAQASLADAMRSMVVRQQP